MAKIIFPQLRDFSAKTSATFEFSRENFLTLCGYLLYLSVPFSLIGGIFQGLSQNNVLAGRSASIFTMEYFAAIFFSVISSIIISISVSTYVISYMRLPDGEKPSFSEVKDGVISNFVKILFSGFLLFLILVLGTLLLVFPGIYLTIPSLFVVFIILYEKLPFGKAFSRALYLVRSNWWATFGYVFVMALIIGLIGLVFTLPAVLITVLKPYLGDTTGPSPIQELLTVIFYTISTIASGLLHTILIVAVVFQYFHLVEKKESAGLIQQIDTLGQAPLDTETEKY